MTNRRENRVQATEEQNLPVHEGDTPPEGQVRGMATLEDLEEGTEDKNEGNA